MDQNFNLGPGFWSYGQKGPKWLEIRKLPKFLESFLFFALRPIGRHGVSSQTAAGTQDQGHKLSNVVLKVAWQQRSFDHCSPQFLLPIGEVMIFFLASIGGPQFFLVMIPLNANKELWVSLYSKFSVLRVVFKQKQKKHLRVTSQRGFIQTGTIVCK